MSGLLTCSAECTVETPITIIDMLEMVDMHDENAKVESLYRTLETGEKAVASLESLVAYKEDLITSDATVSKQTVDALNITLESVCSILDYPVDHVTMSTESIIDDDTTLVLATGLEKEKNLLDKAWAAIKKVLGDIYKFTSNLLKKIRGNAKKMPKVANKLVTDTKLVAEKNPEVFEEVIEEGFSKEVSMDIAKNFGIMGVINGNKLDIDILDIELKKYIELYGAKPTSKAYADIKARVNEEFKYLEKWANGELTNTDLAAYNEFKDKLAADTPTINFKDHFTEDLLKLGQINFDHVRAIIGYSGSNAACLMADTTEPGSPPKIVTVEFDIDYSNFNVSPLDVSDTLDDTLKLVFADLDLLMDLADSMLNESKALTMSGDLLVKNAKNQSNYDNDDNLKNFGRNMVRIQKANIILLSKMSSASSKTMYSFTRHILGYLHHTHKLAVDQL